MNIRYKSGDAYFTSKVAAYYHHFRYDTPQVECVFKDNSFEDLDWTKEPNESFEDLCRERALQIRDSHKHITLSFSGGSDSNHILEIFLKYDIKIDQIVVIRDKIFNLDPHPTNWEVDNHAIPYLKSKNLNIPIRIVDDLTFDHVLDFVSNDLSHEEWNCAQNVDVTAFNWYFLNQFVPNTMLIDGATHPTIFYDSDLNKFYTEIWDTDNFYLRTKLTCEHFFTTTDLTKLHLKQCHIVKNYLRSNNLMHATKDNYNVYKHVLLKIARPLSFNTTDSPFFHKLDKFYADEKNPVMLAQDKKTQMFIRHIHKISDDLSSKYIGNMIQTIGGMPIWKLPFGTRMLKKYLE